jgi:hypothetical protein
VEICIAGLPLDDRRIPSDVAARRSGGYRRARLSPYGEKKTCEIKCFKIETRAETVVINPPFGDDIGMATLDGQNTHWPHPQHPRTIRGERDGSFAAG